MKRIISIIMSTVFVLQVLNYEVFASRSLYGSGKIPLEDKTADYNLSENGNYLIIDEVYSERDSFSKTFLLEDGSFYSITASRPIHRLLNGKWIDIDDDWHTPNYTLDAENAINSLSVSEEMNEVDSFKRTTNNRMIVENDGNPVPVSIRFIGKDENNNNNINTICNTYGGGLWLKPSNVSLYAYGCQVATTELKISLDVSYYRKKTGSSYVEAHEVFSTWDNNTVYNLIGDTNLLSYNTRTLDSIKITSAGTYTWDITDSYSKWERDVLSNNGVVFITPGNNVIRIGGYSVSRKYRIISENDSGFSYQQIDMGRAGILYLNDYTGTIKLVRDECAINGNIMPVSLSRSFNYGFDTTSYNYSGKGARWNYSSILSEISSNIYCWNNLDGETLFFVRPDQNNIITDNAGRQKWSTIDGSCSLWININYSILGDLSFNYIETGDGYKYYFDENGRVISIKDEYENETSIYYNNNGQIDSIIDGVGRCYRFDLGNISGLNLSGVKSIAVFPNSEENTDCIQINNTDCVLYYQYRTVPNLMSGLTNIALSKVVYPDGEEVTYTYDDTTGRLTGITSNDGAQLSVEYISNYSNRVSSISKTKGGHNIQKIELNMQNTYLREIELNRPTNPEQGYVPQIEVVHYNKNLDVVYRKKPDGSESYFGYNQNGDLTNIILPETEDSIVLSGDFEGNNELYWYDDDGTTHTIVTENGNKKLKVTANELLIHRVIQDIELTGESGDQYVIYGTLEANNSIPVHSREIKIEVIGNTYDDYENELIETILGYATFDSTLINNKQTSFGRFIYTDDFDSYDFITINIDIKNQKGDFYFDNIGIYKAESGVIELDGNTNNQGNCSCANCQSSNCSCECVNNCNSNCACCNTMSIETVDVYGNITKSGISVFNKEYAETNNYSSDGNYLTKTIDVSGIETAYVFNTDNGMLERITEGENDYIDYSYTAMGMLTGVNQVISSLSDTDTTVEYDYTHDKLTSIEHNGVTYRFIYDDYGNITCEQVEDSLETQRSVVNYSYDSDFTVSKLNTITYGNNNYIHYTYDNDNITQIYINNNVSPRYEYSYNTDGTISSYVDNETGLTTNYDEDGGYSITNSSEQVIYSVSLNNDGQLVEEVFGTTYLSGDNEIPAYGEHSYNCSTGKTNYQTTISGPIEDKSLKTSITNDALGRIDSKEYMSKTEYFDPFMTFKLDYQYDDAPTKATNQVSNITTTHYYNPGSGHLYYGISDDYSYDNNGRITDIERTRQLQLESNLQYSQNITYEYDSIGQLIRENNEEVYNTFVYYYGPYGNITSVETYPYTTSSILGSPLRTDTYTYDSNYGDLLSTLNSKSLTYDGAGNPLSLGTDCEFEWQGKRLKSYKYLYTYDDNLGDVNKYQKQIFEYDANGNIVKKTSCFIRQNNDVVLNNTTYYIWDNDRLVAQQVINSSGSVGTTIRYLYNSSDEAYGLILNDEELYYYVKDQTGNVIEIYTENGCKSVVQYKYDAWGNMSYSLSYDNMLQYLGAWSVVLTNSITYKGYFYDQASNIYYLKTRFYNPQWRRFLNSDGIYDAGLGVLGTNLYAYCCNDPINKIDSTGTWAKDVHSGVDTKKLNGQEYGTYVWAVNCGMNRTYAEYLATECYAVDSIFRGNSFLPYIGDQSWHFNTNAGTSKKDSRIINSEKALGEALNSFLAARQSSAKNTKIKLTKKGLSKLGLAIHPIQDIYAHTPQVCRFIAYSTQYSAYRKIWYHPKKVNGIEVDSAKAHASVVLGPVKSETVKLIDTAIKKYPYLKDRTALW